MADAMINYVIDKAIESMPLDHQPNFFVAMLTMVLLLLLIPPLLIHNISSQSLQRAQSNSMYQESRIAQLYCFS